MACRLVLGRFSRPWDPVNLPGAGVTLVGVTLTPEGIVLRPTGPVEPLDRRVLGLAAVGVGGFGLAAIYQLSGDRHLGIPCLLHATTGLNCPLCGSTRMAAALLRGDLDAAWHFNPVVLVLGPLIGVAIGYQLLAYGLERVRWVKLPRIRLSARVVDWSIKALIVLLLVYGVARNLN
ncbi:uncharacterized protein DUF2752 [Kribbella orskensis]|uniref:Uncharacterized protein DUF2752 n=1 Tax=Kribbella orskensis TaxID=2512216 RepID=A0ABY2BLZ0_9ACTN|nr:uncharacterized protein DUF2752 [Kribbella sp. VKM Ac-2500]TCO24157.1 uncharacterized protein DUF2752 [Kribbella orskensis]